MTMKSGKRENKKEEVTLLLSLIDVYSKTIVMPKVDATRFIQERKTQWVYSHRLLLSMAK